MARARSIQVLVAGLVLLASALARATDEPEQVYAKLHPAFLAGDIDEIKKHVTAEQVTTLGSLGPVEQTMLNFVRSVTPKKYTVDRKTVDGDRATLVLSGEQPGPAGKAPGRVTLLREKGEWKVDKVQWGTPEALAAAPASRAQPEAPARVEPIPDSPAQGEVNGVRFTLQRAYIWNGILHLRQGLDIFPELEFVVRELELGQSRKLDGLRLNVAGQGGFDDPRISLSYRVPGRNLPDTETFIRGYQLRLEFDEQTGKSIRGRIHLQLPTKAKTYVAGTFEAEIE